jgi:hypothetical protein
MDLADRLLDDIRTQTEWLDAQNAPGVHPHTKAFKH